MKQLIRLILLSLSTALAACATTSVEESWRHKSYQPPTEQKVLIVALAQREPVRKVFEKSFVKELEGKGIFAIPSHHWIEDITKVNRDALRPLLKQNGITTVLVSSIKGIESTETFQPAQSTGPDDNLFRNFNTYQVYSSSGEHETGGSYNERTEYLLETNLFEADKEQLSWSVTTRSNAPRTLEKAVQELISVVIKQAEKDGVM